MKIPWELKEMTREELIKFILIDHPADSDFWRA